MGFYPVEEPSISFQNQELKEKDKDINFYFLNDTFSFLKEMKNPNFIECDYEKASSYNARFPHIESSENVIFKRKARQLLAIAKKTLDSLEIPFWLSSGTCLGKLINESK